MGLLRREEIDGFGCRNRCHIFGLKAKQFDALHEFTFEFGIVKFA